MNIDIQIKAADIRPWQNGIWSVTFGSGGLAAEIVSKFAQPLHDLYTSLTNRGTQAQQLLTPQFGRLGSIEKAHLQKLSLHRKRGKAR